MSGGAQKEAEQLLASLRGIRKVAALDHGQRARVGELEMRFQASLAVPVRNLGVSLMEHRDACLVVLKAAGFRPPAAPTVYMVEEGATEDEADNGAPVLRVADRIYRVIGEEVVDASRRYDERVIRLEDSFVIFPERRRDPGAPCSFILPPLPFPELERLGAGLGIRDAISTSPSLVSDSYLRETFGFSPSNDYATLLIGFNLRAP